MSHALTHTQLCCFFVCSQTQGQQLIVRGRELDFPHVRGARRTAAGSTFLHTQSIAEQPTRPEQRKLALPQRQTAFRQPPPTVISTLLTVEAVNPNTGGVCARLLSFSLRLYFSFFKSYSLTNGVAFLPYGYTQTHLLPQCVLACCCQCASVFAFVCVCAGSERLRISLSFPGGVCYIH